MGLEIDFLARNTQSPPPELTPRAHPKPETNMATVYNPNLKHVMTTHKQTATSLVPATVNEATSSSCRQTISCHVILDITDGNLLPVEYASCQSS